LRDGLAGRCQSSQLEHGQEGAKGRSFKREKPEERVVCGLISGGFKECHPRGAGERDEVIREGSERTTFDELTRECLPFGDGPRGVKTEEGVWELVRMGIGVAQAGYDRDNE
jgi:hypothetical protein